MILDPLPLLNHVKPPAPPKKQAIHETCDSIYLHEVSMSFRKQVSSVLEGHVRCVRFCVTGEEHSRTYAGYIPVGEEDGMKMYEHYMFFATWPLNIYYSIQNENNWWGTGTGCAWNNPNFEKNGGSNVASSWRWMFNRADIFHLFITKHLQSAIDPGRRSHPGMFHLFFSFGVWECCFVFFCILWPWRCLTTSNK